LLLEVVVLLLLLLLVLLLLLLLLPCQLTSCTRNYLTLYSHCILLRRLLARLWLHLWLTFSYYKLLLLYLNLLRLLLLWLKEKY
jgi:hypothetical protein